MKGITTYLLILTLNVNGLNSTIKRHHLTNWNKKEDPPICCLQETNLIDRNKHRLRMKDSKDLPSQWAPKTGKSRNTYLRQSRLQTYIEQWEKEGHSILIKGEIHQKEITIINLYAPNVNAHNFFKHTLKDLKTYKTPTQW
jgi:exonuclease III